MGRAVAIRDDIPAKELRRLARLEGPAALEPGATCARTFGGR